jgi:PAS domain S-box-containing protein
MFGLTRTEFIGKEPSFATHPEDYGKSSAQFKDLLEGKYESIQDERRYIRKNGEVFWAHTTMSVVRDETGTPLYMVGMVLDIDEKKQVMEELQTSEARFRAMFEDAGIGIALVGLDRSPRMVNNEFVRMSGYSREELLAKNGFDLSYPADRDVAIPEFHEMLEGKRDSIHVERRYTRKNGEPYWVRQTISSVRQSDGKVLYLVVMVEDIHQQKQDQETLRESEARFKAMFDNTSVGIALTSLDRGILQVNEAAARITGYPMEELITMNPINLALPEDRHIGDDILHEMIAGKRDSMRVERRYVRKNGEVFWGRVTYSLVRSPDRQPVYLIGLIEDINEQKLAAQKMAEQEAEYRRTLEQRVQERTRELSDTNLRLVNEIEYRHKAEEALASKAAEEAIAAERTRLARDLHDAVTQTLFSASLIAEVLPDIWDMDPEEARKSTEELRQLTRGALAEMRTLLLELRPAALTQARFPDLVKQLSEAVIGRARLPIHLDVKGDYEMPPEVKVAFYRIAQESLNNVVKYARATQVEVYLDQVCCDVHMRIRDNGIGFDPASIKPTSLGMRIMRERAEAIHAHFNINSTPGQGTTVSLDWNEEEIIPISSIRIGGRQ